MRSNQQTVQVLLCVGESTWARSAGVNDAQHCQEWLSRVFAAVTPVGVQGIRVRVKKIPIQNSKVGWVATAITEEHAGQIAANQAARPAVLLIDSAHSLPEPVRSVVSRLTNPPDTFVMWAAYGNGIGLDMSAMNPAKTWAVLARTVAQASCSDMPRCSNESCLLGPVFPTPVMPAGYILGICGECAAAVKNAKRSVEMLERLARFLTIQASTRHAFTPKDLLEVSQSRLSHACERPFERSLVLDDQVLLDHARTEARNAGHSCNTSLSSSEGVDVLLRTQFPCASFPDWADCLRLFSRKVDALCYLSAKRHRDHCRHTELVTLLGDFLWTTDLADGTPLLSSAAALSGVDAVDLRQSSVVAGLLHDCGLPLGELIRLCAIDAEDLEHLDVKEQIDELSNNLLRWLAPPEVVGVHCSLRSFLDTWAPSAAGGRENSLHVAEKQALELAQWLFDGSDALTLNRIAKRVAKLLVEEGD